MKEEASRCLVAFGTTLEVPRRVCNERPRESRWLFLFFVDEGRIVLPVLSAADKEVDPVLTLSVSVPLTM